MLQIPLVPPRLNDARSKTTSSNTAGAHAIIIPANTFIVTKTQARAGLVYLNYFITICIQQTTHILEYIKKYERAT